MRPSTTHGLAALALALAACGGDADTTAATTTTDASSTARASSTGTGGSGGAGGGGCASGTADCNGDPSDGCETSIDDDGHNCGACGHDCLGAACVKGLCAVETLYTGDLVSTIALDAINVYIDPTPSGASTGAIAALPKAGGAKTVLASGLTCPYGLAIEGATIYWASCGVTTNHADGQILSMPLAGGAPTTLVATIRNPSRVYADADNLYFAGLLWRALPFSKLSFL